MNGGIGVCASNQLFFKDGVLCVYNASYHIKGYYESKRKKSDKRKRERNRGQDQDIAKTYKGIQIMTPLLSPDCLLPFSSLSFSILLPLSVPSRGVKILHLYSVDEKNEGRGSVPRCVRKHSRNRARLRTIIFFAMSLARETREETEGNPYRRTGRSIR